jgi:hypothetical protein
VLELSDLCPVISHYVLPSPCSAPRCWTSNLDEPPSWKKYQANWRKKVQDTRRACTQTRTLFLCSPCPLRLTDTLSLTHTGQAVHPRRPRLRIQCDRITPISCHPPTRVLVLTRLRGPSSTINSRRSQARRSRHPRIFQHISTC